MFKHVLLSVDLEHESSWIKALPLALDLCKSCGAALHVLTVVPDFGMSIVGQYFPENFEKEVGEKVLAKLKDFVAEKVPDEYSVQHIVGEGSVYEVILKMAGTVEADLIIMASHRPELQDYLLGPNAARVIRHAKCSVMVVRD